MQLRLITRRLRRRTTLELRVRRRLAFALDRFRAHVHSVSVLLEDTNGEDKGGVDKRVVVQVDLVGPGGGRAPVRVSKSADRIEVAIDRAMDRVARALARRLERDSDRRRSRRDRRQPPLAEAT